MPGTKKTKTSKRQVKVGKLKTQTKSLTAKDAKNVKGGGTASAPKKDGSLDAGVHFKYDIKGNKEG